MNVSLWIEALSGERVTGRFRLLVGDFWCADWWTSYALTSRLDMLQIGLSLWADRWFYFLFLSFIAASSSSCRSLLDVELSTEACLSLGVLLGEISPAEKKSLTSSGFYLVALSSLTIISRSSAGIHSCFWRSSVCKRSLFLQITSSISSIDILLS